MNIIRKPTNDEIDRCWPQFREYVKKEHKIDIKYENRKEFKKYILMEVPVQPLSKKEQDPSHMHMKKCIECGRKRPLNYFKDNDVCNYCYYSVYDKVLRADISLIDFYSRYDSGAKRRGYDFNLLFDEFITLIILPCLYCGNDPSPFNGIDRLDNTIGYEWDNCVPCCSTCNRMKWQHSVGVFLDHINKIQKHVDS